MDNHKRLWFIDVVDQKLDAKDRLISYDDNVYTYTANGELTTKTDTVTNEITRYDYDAFSNLRAVTLPDGTDIEYVIDGQNRRVGKKRNGVLESGFLYQGQLSPVAELDGNSNVIARFVYGDKGHVPSYMVKDSINYRIVSDHLGSVRLVVNASTGEVAQRMDYDAWGKVTNDTNPGFQPFGYAGGIHDRDTGLVRFGARDYDPEIGRWTTKDPIGFAGGINHFVYVENAPILSVDSTGLCKKVGENLWDCDGSSDNQPFQDWNHNGQNSTYYGGPNYGDMQACPSSPPVSDPNWEPYYGDPDVFHCGFQGFLENKEPSVDSPMNECFYDEENNLVDINHPQAACGGSPNVYGQSSSVMHTFLDPGGIFQAGGLAFVES